MKHPQRRSTSRHFKAFFRLHLVLLPLWLIANGCGKKGAEPINGIPETTDRKSNEKPVFMFVNRTADSSIDGTYRNGFELQHRSMLETLGGGVGVVDYDLDGQIDCYFNGGGDLSKDKKISGHDGFLFRNLQNWKFAPHQQQAGINTDSIYDHGCQWGDIDNDGFADLVITGYQGILVFRNLGDGSFEQIDCGIETDQWATSSAFGDFDKDGNLDLFVCQYIDWTFENHMQCTAYNRQKDICSPKFFKPIKDRLYTSQGDWKFKEDSKAKGIDGLGKSLGVVVGDIDLDGDTDIYVACDVTNNLFYLNQGDGTFIECGATCGVDTGDKSMPNGSMGTGITDFNQDMLPDIGVANYENEDFALYKQIKIGGDTGSLIFSLASKKTKLTAIDQLYVSWGTLFEDFDADGDDDLVINNGHVEYFPKSGSVPQTPQIFENKSGVYEYRKVVDSAYFAEKHYGRGLAAADFDNDGDLDLVFSNNNENFAILENKTPQKNKLSRIQLIGTTINRDGIGTSISNPAKKRLKLRIGGGSYLSSSDPACWLVLDPGTKPALKNVGETILTQDESRIFVIEKGSN